MRSIHIGMLHNTVFLVQCTRVLIGQRKTLPGGITKHDREMSLYQYSKIEYNFIQGLEKGNGAPLDFEVVLGRTTKSMKDPQNFAACDTFPRTSKMIL